MFGFVLPFKQCGMSLSTFWTPRFMRGVCPGCSSATVLPWRRPRNCVLRPLYSSPSGHLQPGVDNRILARRRHG
eukprot:2047712-Pyramimonas_sp.AAC.1